MSPPKRPLSLADPLSSPPFPTTWNWFSHGPLRGLTLERESLSIVAWDDARHLYRLRVSGTVESEVRLADPIRLLATSDTGAGTFVLTEPMAVQRLDRAGRAGHSFSLPFEPTTIATDPFGEYVAFASSDARLSVMDRLGRCVASVSTPQPYRHLAFLPSRGQIVAAAEQGIIACHDLRGNLLWKETMYSTVGSLAVDYTGRMIAIASFGYGIVRYSPQGRREGAYQLPRSPHLVGVDFDAQRMVAGSVDGFVLAMNYEGQVLGERPLAEKPIGLAIDPLGRFVVMGFASGEVRFLEWSSLLQDADSSADEMSTPAEDSLGSGPARVRRTAEGAAWSAKVGDSLDEARAVVFEPLTGGGVAFSTPGRTIRIVGADGREKHESPRLEGAGRLLRGGPGGLFAATDRRILFYDERSNQSTLFPLGFFDVSHLLPLAAEGEAIVVESCDQWSRVRVPGKTLWKDRLPMRVVHVAVGREDRVALVLEDHQLMVLDREGKKLGRFRAARPTPLLLATGPSGWITASIGEQMLRHHDIDGRVLASLPLPWDPWGLWPVGNQVVVTRANGESLLVDPTTLSGSVGTDSSGAAEPSVNTEPREGAAYALLHSGVVARAFRAGASVVVTDFAGKLLWRSPPQEEIHQFALRRAEVWILAGRRLGYFPLAPTSSEPVPPLDRR
jgi:hypothetical protein